VRNGRGFGKPGTGDSSRAPQFPKTAEIVDAFVRLPYIPGIGWQPDYRTTPVEDTFLSSPVTALVACPLKISHEPPLSLAPWFSQSEILPSCSIIDAASTF